jgi:SAM-dependent methyltransferase
MMGGRTLSPDHARRTYDRIGSWLDTQRFYEDPALDELVRRGEFGNAKAVIDFGCGTGRLLERLLRDELPPSATVLGLDLSPRMTGLTQDRLSAYSRRATVRQGGGADLSALPPASSDRFLATYVLDLMSQESIAGILQEARRLLTPDGLLCIAALGEGEAGLSRLVSGTITFFNRLSPVLTSGCRPIALESILVAQEWSTNSRTVLSAYGITSQIIVAANLPERRRATKRTLP